MGTVIKNKYEKEDDRIVLQAMEENPDNKTEALRVASDRIKRYRGKDATVNQLSSRYYSYIVPHYIEGNAVIDDEPEYGDENKHVIHSAGTFETRNPRVDVIVKLSEMLDDDKRQEVIKRIFERIGR